MNILHLNTNDYGGAAIAAIRLHKLLLNKGYTSKILFLKKTREIETEHVYYLEDTFKSKLIFKFLYKINTLYNRRFTFCKPNIYFNGPESLFKVEKNALYKDANIIHLHWVSQAY
ncbi:MAG: hypothetical protein R2852_08030 [Bacteroidia bacterium]